jgi:hypothetical protein
LLTVKPKKFLKCPLVAPYGDTDYAGFWLGDARTYGGWARVERMYGGDSLHAGRNFAKMFALRMNAFPIHNRNGTPAINSVYCR